MRIVSLLPGATESLFALGLGDSLVGVSHECELAPCGLPFERALAEARRLAAEIERVRARRVTVFDGSAYFNRAGPRLVDSLELLVRETEGYRCLV